MRVVGVLLAVVLLAGGSVPTAAAQPEHTVEQDIPFHAILADCVAEQVLVTGSTHVVFHLSTNGAGELRLWIATSTSGTGVGLATGAPYVVAGKDHFSLKLGPTGAQEIHIVLDSRLRGLAQVQDSMLYFSFKVTIPASGGPPSAEHQRAGCRFN